MKIGVYVEGNRQQGGGFTHQLNVLKLLKKNSGNDHEFLIFCSGTEILQAARSEGLSAVSIKQNLWLKAKRLLLRQAWTYSFTSMRIFSRFLISPLEVIFKQHEIDLVFFPVPSAAALELVSQNYIFSVWDLCHLEQPEFPEVKSARDFELREELYQKALKKAVAVITDSDFGKNLVVGKYQLEPDRVVALPFLPSSYAQNFKELPGRREEIYRKYGIIPPFIFYPAQFWAHKNHVYILRALQYLRSQHGLNVQAVFAGSDQGNRTLVNDKAAALKVADLVNCVGYVDDDEMPYLFQGAMALTMPTYFGPTNIPPLDAFALSCPVCYSDLPAFREQLGEAAFFVDLANPESLGEMLLAISQQPDLVAEKIRLGTKHVENWSDQQFFDELNSLFTRYARKQDCWK